MRKNLLKEKIEQIPTKPGVYKMKDIYGNIIYVGKSKALKTRVKSYFNREHDWEKIKQMVYHINDIDYIVTDTHLEAQILECALIKKIKPIYNSQFKNHSKYSYLKIDDFNRFKPIVVVPERDGENCFGPLRNKSMITEVVDFFKNIYPLTKHNCNYDFTYKIIPEKINNETFEQNKQILIEIFSKKKCMLKFKSKLEEKMNEAAMNLQFEKATIYRNIINNLSYIHTIKTNTIINKNVVLGEKLDKGYKLFYISNSTLIYKLYFEELTKRNISDFIIKAKELELKKGNITNEKKDLDYKSIVNSEIKNHDQSLTLYLDKNYDIDAFINNLHKRT